MQIDAKTKALLAEPSKRWGWLIFQLHLKGLTMADLAREAGFTRHRMYVAQRQPSPRIEGLIAEALKVPAATLFPDRYDTDGLPLKRRGQWRVNKRYQGKSNAVRKTRNAQTRARA